MEKLSGQQLGPVIIRALAVNAAMLNNKALYDAMLSTLVTENADISDTEKAYLLVLQTQWFSGLPYIIVKASLNLVLTTPNERFQILENTVD